MAKACTFDTETTYGTYLGRAGSPFSCGEISLCAAGFLFEDDEYKSTYFVDYDEFGKKQGVPRNSTKWFDSFPDLGGVDVLVGHNIKFDLLWYWRHPRLESFLARGGRVWDTLYAEYLLSGQFYTIDQLPHLVPSLHNVAKRRECTHKLDVVAALWDKGVRTEDIQEQVLMEYLNGDCVSTREIYDSQMAQAARQNQMHMIEGRMDGLLATTEMEFNGLMIDLDEAEARLAVLTEQVDIMQESLNQYLPEGMPDEFTFNWNSPAQLSALIFGGEVKYKAPAIKTNEDGSLQYYKKTIKEVVRDANGEAIRFLSGKNAGATKTRNKVVEDIERGPKTRIEDHYFDLPRQAQPKDKWLSGTAGQWSTAAGVLEEVSEQGIGLVSDLLAVRGLEKDIGTYYRRLYKGKWTGMLTMVGTDGVVHHNLNHAITKTTRLSSSKPNLQNLSGTGKSEVRKMFVSRFGPDGIVVEGDYSQLEVVCKAVLSEDWVLMEALLKGVDFHCDWLSLSPAGEGKSYDEIHRLCKVDHDPVWAAKRKGIKPLTFGESFGAGIPKLCADTGMCAEDVKAAIDARKAKYYKMYQYDEDNIEKVKNSRKVSPVLTAAGMQAGIGYLRSATDTIFHFLELDAPDWMQHKGTMTSFAPQTIKNYPTQGLGGEIMQVQAGRIFRWLIANNRFDDKFLITNTVHDCCWADVHKDAQQHLAEMKRIMEDVSPYFTKHYPNVNWTTPFPTVFEVGPTMYDLEPIDI